MCDCSDTRNFTNIHQICTMNIVYIFNYSTKIHREYLMNIHQVFQKKSTHIHQKIHGTYLWNNKKCHNILIEYLAHIHEICVIYKKHM